MRKATFIALLFTAAFAAVEVAGGRRPQEVEGYSMDEDDRQQSSTKPFKAGNEYTFTYNTQIASGMVAPETSGEPGLPQQKSVTRMQAKVSIQFQSDRHASLRMDQIRFGQLNEQIPMPDRVKPMRMFEQKQLSQEKYATLQFPAQFIYTDGVIERIQFHQRDETWSKNIKRAVLNMIQLNLKRNNAQGLRLPEDLSNGIEGEATRPGEPKAFSLPEVTIEGECQTLYTVTHMNRQKEFNVTKSVDFKKCRKIADVAYGYQTQQVQPQCSQCQLQWYRDLQVSGKVGQPEESQQAQINPCELCDPKEVKERKLSRSTVQRFVLEGDEKQHAIRRSELTSQYVLKNLKAESGEYGSAMHTIVSKELIFRGAQPLREQDRQQQRSSDKDESLLFSNQWDVEEKRFYMYGDEEYNRNSPFKEVQNKPQLAEQAVRKLLQIVASKDNGIEIDAPIQMQRFVEVLRMASVEEMSQIERAIMSAGRNPQDKQKAVQFFYDALAIAGTRNTIAVLIEKILAKEMSDSQAVQALMSLQGLPAPSDSQIKLVLRLAQSEVARRSERLRQTSWLMLGSMINEVCQHKTQKNAQQTIFGAQSGFTTDELCSLDKKQKYRDALMELYKNAETTYDKMLSIVAIANSGLDIAITELEGIITDTREDRVVRHSAIEALRRLRSQMPRKVQNILMPLFLNTREQPEVRMAAFGQIMNTLPSQQVIDQIAYALTKEPSQHVLSYVYNSMKSMAKTQNPVKEQIAKHIQNALKLVNVDDKSLKRSGVAQIPIFSQELNEGVFVNLMSASSPMGYLPSHLGLQLNSFLNDEYQTSDVAMHFKQQNLEELYDNIVSAIRMSTRDEKESEKPTRAQRLLSSDSKKGSFHDYVFGQHKSRRDSYDDEAEDVKGKRQEKEKGKERPFAMLNLRIGGVDKAFIPLSQRYAPEILKKLFRDDSLSLKQIVSSLGMNRHFLRSIAMNMNEKRATIATSAGIPLKAIQSAPVIATIDVQTSIRPETEGKQLGIRAQAKGQVALNIAHIQKLQLWLPLFSTGVQSIRALEINAPIDVEASLNKAQGFQLKMKIPEKEVQLIGLHSLPTTYTAEFDDRRKATREPKIKTIHNPQIEESQREVNSIVGRLAGIPLHIKGHYYRPAELSNYKQFVQMMMAAENQVHVTYKPSQEPARELILRAQLSHFENAPVQSPDFTSFYDRQDRFSSTDSEESYEHSESHNDRKQKFDKFVKNYQPGKMYRSAVKMSIQTVGGHKEAKAQMEIGVTSDPKLKVSKLDLNVERTPMFESEQEKWTMKSEARMVTPESVSSVDQADQLSEKQKMFVLQSQAKWGPAEGKKQEVSVRIQGQKAMKGEWRKFEEQQSRQNKYFKRQTAFLNMYQMEVDYTLRPPLQAMFSRVFQAFKAKNYWNTETKPLRQESGSQESGQVQATLVINPIDQKQANLTVKTSTEVSKIESLHFPMLCRPFPLIRSSEKSYHSIDQVMDRVSVSKRAECTVDGRQVRTFDDETFKAPMGKCFTVLAKDCRGKRPRFAVLMKAMDKESRQMKIKVVSPEQTIECQPKDSRGEKQRLSCKVNGQQVAEHNNDIEDQTVEYNDNQKSDVTVNVEGVSVRFNGRRAWIKIAKEYKNGQCGVCGHYDGESGNEYRMSNNEETDDISQFHRSYSVQQSEECTAEEQEEFYSKEKKRFGRKVSLYSEEERRMEGRNGNGDYAADQESQDDMQEEEEWYTQNFEGEDNEREKRQWGWGGYWGYTSGAGLRDSEREKRQYYDGGYGWGYTSGDDLRETPQSPRLPRGRRQPVNQDANEPQEDENSEYRDQPQKRAALLSKLAPRKQTVGMEAGTSKICFSMEPVKKCPEGTYPSNSDLDLGYFSDKEQRSQDRQSSMIKVKFTCMARSSTEARDFLRRVRRGELIRELQQFPHTLTEEVREPAKCSPHFRG